MSLTEEPKARAEQCVILHVDDDPNDAYLFARAMRKLLPGVVLWQARNGEEAKERLSELDGHPQHRPDVVVLDLKMGRMDGFELMGWIKGRAGLARAKVIVLSGSECEGDHGRSSSLGAAAFLIKGTNWDDVARAVLKSCEAV